MFLTRAFNHAPLFFRFFFCLLLSSPKTSAGVAASLISQPSDTIFVEVSDKGGPSAGILSTVKDVYEEGGPGAFYKGALPRAAKSALNIALQFFLYDSLKRLANVAPNDLKVCLRFSWRVCLCSLALFVFPFTFLFASARC